MSMTFYPCPGGCLDWQENGINIDGLRLNNLRFADDIVIVASTSEELKNMLS